MLFQKYVQKLYVPGYEILLKVSPYVKDEMEEEVATFCRK